jgi:hypothetical protein
MSFQCAAICVTFWSKFYNNKKISVTMFRFLGILLSAMILTACGESASEKPFKIDLIASIFNDITIAQGETGTAELTINRFGKEHKYDGPIKLRLVDPPEWLSYQFANNPAAGEKNSLKIKVDPRAKPGIYRMTLEGFGNTGSKIIEDRETFHLQVAQQSNDKPAIDNNATASSGKNLFSVSSLKKDLIQN